MRRPFAVIGFAFFVTLFALYVLPLQAVWVLLPVSGGCCAAAVAVRRLRREPLLLCSLFAVLAACLVMLTALQTVWEPVRALDGRKVAITAHMADLPHHAEDGDYRCLLRTDTVDAQPMRCRILLYTDEVLPASFTDRLSFTAKLYAVSAPAGDGTYFLIYETDALTVMPDNPTWLSRALTVRSYVTRTMQQKLPGTPGAVLTAMLLGDSSFIPSGTYLRMRRSGILHIFSISGFHLTVFAVSFLRLLEKRRVSRFVYVPLCTALVLFVMAATGFPLSCSRAGLMVMLMLVGKLFSRRTDAINSLGFVLLVMGLVNPFCAGEVGLQLSVLGTVGIVTGTPVIGRIVSRIRIPFAPLQGLLRTACGTAMVSAYVTILTLPIVLFAFGAVSVVAPLTNACMLPAAEFAMILGTVCVLLSLHPVLGCLFHPVSLAAGLLARWCVAVSDFFGSLPFAAPRFDATETGLWICGTLVLVATAILLRIPLRRKIVLTAVLVVLLTTLPIPLRAWSMHDTATVTILPVGDNTAVLVQSGSHTALIGCGGAQTARVVSAGTDRLDWMLLPRTEKTEIGGAPGVLRTVYTSHVYVPERSAATAALYLAHTPEPLPQRLAIGEGVFAECSAVPEAPAVRLQLYGKTMLMLFSPGCDLSALPQGWLDADMLYVRGDIPSGISPGRFGCVVLQTDDTRSAQIIRAAASCGGEAMGAGKLIVDKSGSIRLCPQ